MNRTKATLIKRAVVSYQWQTVYQRFDFRPYFWKIIRFYRVIVRESVDSCRPLCLVVGGRTNQTIDFVYNLAILYNDNTNTAYASTFAVGCFKVDSSKIPHLFFYFEIQMYELEFILSIYVCKIYPSIQNISLLIYLFPILITIGSLRVIRIMVCASKF